MGKAGQRGKQRRRVSSSELQGEIRAVNAQVGPLGLKVRDVPGDGNCLFRAASDQMHETSNKHAAVRQETVQYIKDHPEAFAPFVEDDEPFEDYVARMQQDSEWGGNIEIQAMSLLYGADIVIHLPEGPRMEVRNHGSTTVWHICYLSGEHYGSVRCVDPAQKEAMVRHWMSSAALDHSVPLPTADKKRGSGKAKYDVPDALVDQVNEALDEPMDEEAVRQAIRDHDYDVDAVIVRLRQLKMQPEPAEAEHFPSSDSSSGSPASHSTKAKKSSTQAGQRKRPDGSARPERERQRKKTAAGARASRRNTRVTSPAPLPTSPLPPGLRI